MLDERQEPGAKKSTCSEFSGGDIELVKLDRDHPGFNDPFYRQRRNYIANQAFSYQTGKKIPEIVYNNSEQGIWQEIWGNLAPMHQRFACATYLEATEQFQFSPNYIPSFCEINRQLQPLQGFTLAPVAGLVEPRTFLEQLGQRRFLATQYMRHPSSPLYTPEPDVVHEYIGHVPLLAHAQMAELNFAFGQATKGASESRIQALIQVYWYTIEFGMVLENDTPKAYGAGILSSFGELERSINHTRHLKWDLDRMAHHDYDPTDYQKELFVAPSFTRLREDLLKWLGA